METQPTKAITTARKSVVAQVKTNGPLQPANYVDPTQRPLPAWGKRADRVYINAVETFAPFAALVIAIHLAGKTNGTTGLLAMSFFWLRVAQGRECARAVDAFLMGETFLPASPDL